MHDEGPVIGAKLGSMHGKGIQSLDPPTPVTPDPLLTPVLGVVGAHRGRVCVIIPIQQVTKGPVPTDLAKSISSK